VLAAAAVSGIGRIDALHLAGSRQPVAAVDALWSALLPLAAKTLALAVDTGGDAFELDLDEIVTTGGDLAAAYAWDLSVSRTASGRLVLDGTWLDER
jgi:hypothetical protein